MKSKVGIIGLGVGEAHLKQLATTHPGCVTAVCDLDETKLSQARLNHPNIFSTNDYRELISRNDVDVVVVASFDQDHCEHAEQALKAGKSVFVEKPLCLSKTEARRIKAALKSSPESQLGSNLIMRYYPRFQRIKRMVEEGRLGSLYYLEGAYDYGRLEKLTQGWRSYPGYSVMLGGGVHILDLLLWLKAGATVTEVTAFGSDLMTKGTSFQGFDCVASLLRFSDGSLARITANFGCVRPHFHEMAVFGSLGTATHRPEGWEIFQSRDPLEEPQFLDVPYPGASKGLMLLDFLAGLDSPVPAQGVPSANEIFSCLSVCFAIDRAAKTGTTTKVEYA